MFHQKFVQYNPHAVPKSYQQPALRRYNGLEEQALVRIPTNTSSDSKPSALSTTAAKSEQPSRVLAAPSSAHSQASSLSSESLSHRVTSSSTETSSKAQRPPSQTTRPRMMTRPASNPPTLGITIWGNRYSPMGFVFLILIPLSILLFTLDVLVGLPAVVPHAANFPDAASAPSDPNAPVLMLSAREHADDVTDQALADSAFEQSLCDGPEFDAILILGGGRALAPDRPPRWTRRRCDIAGRLFQCRQLKKRKQQQQQQQQSPESTSALSTASASAPVETQNTHSSSASLSASSSIPAEHVEYILALSAGSAHAALPLDDTGFPLFESSVSARYLYLRYQILPSMLLVESSSYDTIGNAFWARTSHVDVRGWRRLLIVTSAYHMPRTKAIFDWVFSLPGKDHADKYGAAPVSAYELVYAEASDAKLSPHMIAARTEREQNSLKTVQKLAQEIGSMPALHHWLSTRHDLYAPARFLTSERELSHNKQLLASYGNT